MRESSEALSTLHTVMSVSRKAGGLQGAVLGLTRALSRLDGIRVSVVGLKDSHSQQDLPQWAPLAVDVLNVRGPRAFCYSPELRYRLDSISPLLLHTHGLWLYPSVATLCWSKRTGRPFVVSPHGMLEPEIELRKSRVRKAISLLLYQNAHLRKASCVHALCKPEAEHIRQFGLKNPVCIIPNGVNLPSDAVSTVDPPWSTDQTRGRKVLLYLGRINRKKGIANLLEAFAEVRQLAAASGWCIAVAGWDQDGCEVELKAQSLARGLGDHVIFVGPLFGLQKEAAYRNAHAFVLPSQSEGFPLVVPEAWSYRLPVVMTTACNIPEGKVMGAALEAKPTVVSLRAALASLVEMTDGERKAMGERGFELVRTRYNWPDVARQMKSVYEWAIGGGPKPSNVEFQ